MSFGCNWPCGHRRGPQRQQSLDSERRAQQPYHRSYNEYEIYRQNAGARAYPVDVRITGGIFHSHRAVLQDLIPEVRIDRDCALDFTAVGGDEEVTDVVRSIRGPIVA